MRMERERKRQREKGRRRLKIIWQDYFYRFSIRQRLVPVVFQCHHKWSDKQSKWRCCFFLVIWFRFFIWHYIHLADILLLGHNRSTAFWSIKSSAKWAPNENIPQKKGNGTKDKDKMRVSMPRHKAIIHSHRDKNKQTKANRRRIENENIVIYCIWTGKWGATYSVCFFIVCI